MNYGAYGIFLDCLHRIISSELRFALKKLCLDIVVGCQDGSKMRFGFNFLFVVCNLALKAASREELLEINAYTLPVLGMQLASGMTLN